MKKETSNSPEMNKKIAQVSILPIASGLFKGFVKAIHPDIAGKIVFEAMLSDQLENDATFQDFRDAVLETIDEQYNVANSYNICSDEYSAAYRAFQIVGLIGNDVDDPELMCNVANYEASNITECPQTLIHGCMDTGTGSQFNMSFPLDLLNGDTYYIQVFIDELSDGNYILDHEYTLTANVTSDVLMMQPVELSNEDVPIQVTIYNVDDLTEPESFTDDSNLIFNKYFFGCNSGCDVIPGTDGGNDDTTPAPNQGQINTTLSNSTFFTCPYSEICLDYESTGPAQTFVDISGDQFAQLITDITFTSQSGTFCWTPDEDEVGTYNFQVTATDGHPTQPITQTSDVTVYVVDYLSDVWITAGPIAYPTNESGAGANDGKIKVHVASIYTLEFHWSGPGISGTLVTYSNGQNGNELTGLGDGTYTVDVYVSGTDCFYNSYTATVGTKSSSGGGCLFDTDLVHMRAIPTIFNDETTIEIELQEKPLQMNLSAYTMQGIPVQNLVNGQVLDVGIHQFIFDGSNEPDGLYIFQLAVTPQGCRSGEQETINIKGFKY